ncbi:hypothetical protein F2P56_031580 [Juglans regia]|uniref:Transmembrane protein n=1 Tax=Juglans regia TaxID=51240 RepID=A0A833U828_JUGRE|nr:hypothetical protein F2P56_031580 [Juglans regia]
MNCLCNVKRRLLNHFVKSNRVKNEFCSFSTRNSLGTAITQLGRHIVAAAGSTAMWVVVVVVVGVSRRVVVHAASLGAVRMKSCGNSHPNIQQLHKLGHGDEYYIRILYMNMNMNMYMNMYLCLFDLTLSLFFPFGGERKKREREREKEEKENGGRGMEQKGCVRKRPKRRRP